MSDGLLPNDTWTAQEQESEDKRRQRLFREWVDYNPLTGVLLRKKSGWLRNVGKPMTIYTDTRDDIIRKTVSVKGRNYQLGNFIWCYQTGYYPKMSEIVYYINGDLTDLRFCNLRVMRKVDYAHLSNRVIDSNCLGVTQNTQGGTRFKAHIERNGRHQSLGIFETAKEARVAYLRAKKSIREQIGAKYGITDVNRVAIRRQKQHDADANFTATA